MNKKLSVAITGLSGIIGQEFIRLFGPKFNITGIIHNNHIPNKLVYRYLSLDLLKTNKIQETLEQIHPDYFIHLAAITHIDNCEADKKNGKRGLVWKINVDASKEIASYCTKK